MFKNHPKGLLAAALSNMGERFGYYIMNAVLVLFLCSKFGISDETSGLIYSVFYCGIYVLSLVGGIIADRTHNYKGTIMSGLIVMALGYAALSVPILATPQNSTGLLIFTCVALFFIAFGNGLFKGNLQAVVGQLYDNFEAEAAKKGEAELKAAKDKRDSGFQIFYVFINIGGLVAPFVAPLLRSWWLRTHDLVYNAQLPALCHKYINEGANMAADQLENLKELAVQVGATVGEGFDFSAFCQNYLQIFNEGVHYSFIASVCAMVISLLIFIATKKIFPTPGKKVKAANAAEEVVEVKVSPEEKAAMAKEIKQRMAALFAVLGICVFFWLSFHQNGQSLSLFARDFVKTDKVAPEIWQAINPFFVITLTPIIMLIFGSLAKRGKAVSTPKKIAFGMGITAMAYVFLMVLSMVCGYPSGEEFKEMAVAEAESMKVGAWALIATYFFLTVAELFISPLGLSFVSKVAPKNIQGLCQGLWLGATALGNLFIWVGPVMYNKMDLWQCWLVFLVICVVAMSVMLGMVKWLERVTK